MRHLHRLPTARAVGRKGSLPGGRPRGQTAEPGQPEQEARASIVGQRRRSRGRPSAALQAASAAGCPATCSQHTTPVRNNRSAHRSLL